MVKSYFYEIPFFYFFLLIINYYFAPDSPAFFGIDPNPFWLGILLFGFRYGLRASLLSGGLAATIYLLVIWIYGERYFFDDVDFYVLPGLFMVISGWLGFFSEKNKKNSWQQLQDQGALKEKLSEYIHEIQILKEINQGLENRIVTRMATLATLYEGARKLETMHLQELYPAIAEFISKTLKAKEVLLYLQKGNQWILEASYGVSSDLPEGVKTVSFNEGLIGRAAMTGLVVSIRDFIQSTGSIPHFDHLPQEGIMAGPIRYGEKGKVVGVVSIRQIPFFSLNSATTNLFHFLLNWASRAIEKASYVEELRDSGIIEPTYQVYSHRYYKFRLEQEFERSKHYSLPLSLGLVFVPFLQSMSTTKKNDFLIALSQMLRQVCRKMDVIAITPDSNIPFAILYLTASERQAKESADKIISHYTRLIQALFGQDALAQYPLELGLSSFNPTMQNESQLEEQAREKIGSKKVVTP